MNECNMNDAGVCHEEFIKDYVNYWILSYFLGITILSDELILSVSIDQRAILWNINITNLQVTSSKYQTVFHNKQCSNLVVGISEGCFIVDFASLPLEVAQPI